MSFTGAQLFKAVDLFVLSTLLYSVWASLFPPPLFLENFYSKEEREGKQDKKVKQGASPSCSIHTFLLSNGRICITESYRYVISEKKKERKDKKLKSRS